MEPSQHPVSDGYTVYSTRVPANRPLTDYTARVIPSEPQQRYRLKRPRSSGRNTDERRRSDGRVHDPNCGAKHAVQRPLGAGKLVPTQVSDNGTLLRPVNKESWVAENLDDKTP